MPKRNHRGQRSSARQNARKARGELKRELSGAVSLAQLTTSQHSSRAGSPADLAGLVVDSAGSTAVAAERELRGDKSSQEGLEQIEPIETVCLEGAGSELSSAHSKTAWERVTKQIEEAEFKLELNAIEEAEFKLELIEEELKNTKNENGGATCQPGDDSAETSRREPAAESGESGVADSCEFRPDWADGEADHRDD